MIYLASPYSHPDPVIKKTRFLLAEQCTASLMNQGVLVWSPIVMCYDITQKFDLPDDAEFWKRYNYDFIRRSDGIYVLDIEGWQESKGVQMEIKLAEAMLLPIGFVNPDGDIALVPHT